MRCRALHLGPETISNHHNHHHYGGGSDRLGLDSTGASCRGLVIITLTVIMSCIKIAIEDTVPNHKPAVSNRETSLHGRACEREGKQDRANPARLK